MRTFTFTMIVWALLALCIVAWNASAHASERRTRYDATLLCAHIAEDSAAHVKLIEYAHEGTRIVYRCKQSGY